MRTLTAVTPKPETDSTAEILNEPLRQIATVSSGVPNIMLESLSFRSWIDSDLRFAYSSAVHAHVIAQIAAANPVPAAAGDDFLESILLAAEEVAAAGYSPTVLAASPESFIQLRLARQPESGDHIFSGNALDLGLRRVAVPGLTQRWSSTRKRSARSTAHR